MRIDRSIARVLVSFFLFVRANAIAGIATAVLFLLAFALYLAAHVAAIGSADFLVFAVLSGLFAVLAIAVLYIVARHKPPTSKR